MSNLPLKELRQKLTEEDVIRVLGKYDVHPVYITDRAIIFPTACHNVSGGSPKLYYYKNDHIFKCYTECNDTFDIFELLIKMHKLRSSEISIYDAVRICGLDTSTISETSQTNSKEDIEYLYNLLYTKNEIIDLPHIDDKIMERFVFDKTALSIWTEEGISYDTMKKYGIAYDPIDNCIIIPNYDINNNLISIRGRYLDPDAAAKYRPITYCRKVLSHPSSLNLFGLNITKDAIKKFGRVVIFESEKSVMMMDTIYGENNCSVATLGKNISKQQIKFLSDLGVREVILAFDADYVDYNQMAAKRNEYLKIGKSLKPYFNVKVLIDLDHLLNYKDSPIDRGKDKFEKILKNGIYI